MIILASASKRRSEILASCGIPHKVVPSEEKEVSGAVEKISKIVVTNALNKARKVAMTQDKGIVIGADTLVSASGRMVGKPASEDEARDILKLFSGSRVEVFSGVSVIKAGTKEEASGFEKSEVYITELSDADIDKFFPLLSPYDKAGGFSIEGVGSLIFDNIRGSYYNVMGLPMGRLRDVFAGLSLDILDYVKT